MEPTTKKKALRRLGIIKGQVQGLEKLVADEKYCIDIITQTSAVRRALSGVEDLLLEHHLGMHVGPQMKHGETKRASKEILKVYKLKRT